MRSSSSSLIVSVVVGAWSATAAASPALVDVEARAGMGVEMGGASQMAMRASAMSIGARVGIAINDEPATWAVIGAMTETGGRQSTGLLAGLRLLPGGPWRLGAAALYAPRPSSLFGAVASVGACARATGAMHLCGDLESTFLVGGAGLPGGRTVTELQLVLGVRFDAM